MDSKMTVFKCKMCGGTIEFEPGLFPKAHGFFRKIEYNGAVLFPR